MNGRARYDVVVVGGRCAGASLATWLARAGVDVLVIDRARDVEALPGYYWGRDEGALDPVSPLEELVLGVIGRDPELGRLMSRLPQHQCSPYDAIPGRAILPIVFGAVARGRFGVIPALLRQARAVAGFRRELRRRMRLLEAVAPTDAGSG